MKPSYFILFTLFLVIGCNKNHELDSEFTRVLTLDDIKHEYIIADSLNRLEDRSILDTGTKILGVDKRNGQVIVRTCKDRGFGCLLYTDYFTLLYLNCDSLSCEKNDGYWLIDYVGIVGARSVVGCAPDTLQ